MGRARSLPPLVQASRWGHGPPLSPALPPHCQQGLGNPGGKMNPLPHELSPAIPARFLQGVRPGPHNGGGEGGKVLPPCPHMSILTAAAMTAAPRAEVGGGNGAPTSWAQPGSHQDPSRGSHAGSMRRGGDGSISHVHFHCGSQSTL